MGEVSVNLRSFLALLGNISDSRCLPAFTFFKGPHVREKASLHTSVCRAQVHPHTVDLGPFRTALEKLSDSCCRGHWTCPDQRAVLNLKEKQSTSKGKPCESFHSRVGEL